MCFVWSKRSRNLEKRWVIPASAVHLESAKLTTVIKYSLHCEFFEAIQSYTWLQISTQHSLFSGLGACCKVLYCVRESMCGTGLNILTRKHRILGVLLILLLAGRSWLMDWDVIGFKGLEA